MFETEVIIPYKSHNNKYIWDYAMKLCEQINNINLSKNLSDSLASFSNMLYILIDGKNNTVNFYIGLSYRLLDGSFKSFIDSWATFQDTTINNISDLPFTSDEYRIFSFDIKKYNQILAFSKEYQNRDSIEFFIDGENLYYMMKNNMVNLSPIVVGDDLFNQIISSYFRYKSLDKREEYNLIVDVDTVDKNSLLLPYMSYKDFLNFVVYSENNISCLFDGHIYNTLFNKDDKIMFSSDISLRQDKFHIHKNDVISSGFWQILSILQNFKLWYKLSLYKQNDEYNIAYLDFNNSEDTTYVTHILSLGRKSEINDNFFDKSKFELVGNLHSNELFKINKLYSNANRTCHFDFSNQEFVGNNYIFNEDKLKTEITKLEEPINDTTIPLKISFTELKHYIGSDLSQKGFILKIFTDGVNIMLERYNDNTNELENRIIFNHNLSKKNQNLPNII